jgi:hypothetical protein
MWTKKSDYAPKSEGVGFFNTCPKKAILERKKNLIILLSSFGLYLSPLLVNRVKDVVCKSSHKLFLEKMSDLMCTCSM